MVSRAGRGRQNSEWAGVDAQGLQPWAGEQRQPLPEDELAVLQRCAWAAPLLQEAHLLVEGQVEAPRPKIVPRE